MKTLTILGSTGSIGTQSLDCARHLNIKVDGICANSSIDILENQIREFSPRFCAVKDENKGRELKSRVSDTNTLILIGEDSILELINLTCADTVINSIIGFEGLLPTLEVINNGKTLAIANKETLVSAGELVMNSAKNKGVFIIPIDSEHCAIHQCLNGHEKNEVKRLILTASGGPFFGKTSEELENVTFKEALKHPNWSMGKKLTIDSATMVNKGLELIEATWLFGLPQEKVDYIVHRESIVHSMVEFADNSILSQMAVPDMRLCIQYALTYPNKVASKTAELDLVNVGKLTFFEGDNKNFPGVDMARKAAIMGGITPCVFNSANEACVDLFLKGSIKFKEIYTLISDAMVTIKKDVYGKLALNDIIEADKQARAFVYSQVK